MYGRLSYDCPVPVERPCYEPCRHEQEVIDYALSPVIAHDEYLIALIKAQLKTQDEFLKMMCEWQPPICLQGQILGFPCVQCGLIIEPAFSFSPSQEILCDSAVYQTINPCKSLCGEICQEKCRTGVVDFSTDSESIALYEKIVEALQMPDLQANWSGIELVAKSIFGELAEVVLFQNDTYHLSIGREMTDFEISAANVILSAFPVPFGAKAEFVEKICDV